MTGLKKLLSLLLTFCMVMCMLPMSLVIANTDEPAYEIVGDTGLYAPPAGKRAAVTYKLIDKATGDEITDATITISKNGDNAIPDGVLYTDARNKIALDGDTIKAGSFTVTLTSASHPSVTASKVVAVDDVRIFWDFENVDDAHTLKKLSGSTETITSTTSRGWTAGSIATVDGNSYMQNGSTSSLLRVATLIKYHTTNKVDPKYVTVDFNLNLTRGAENGTYSEYGSNWGIGYTESGKLTVGVFDADTNANTYAESALDVRLKEWNNIQLTINYDEKSILPAVNGIADNEKYYFTAATGNGSANLFRLKSWNSIDNVAIYSGEPLALTEEVFSPEVIEGLVAEITADDVTDESLESVTGNIFSPLPDSVAYENETASITWESSDSDTVNAETGAVNRGTETKTVFLTAKFTWRNHTFRKVFEITVPANPDAGETPDTGEDPDTGETPDTGEDPDTGDDEPKEDPEPVIPNKGDTYELKGDTILYAPPKGKRSVITYKLINKSQEKEVTDGIISVHGLDGDSVPKGVFYTEGKNKLVLDGDLAESGSFTVRVTSKSYPEMTSSLDVIIENDRVFWDFNDIENDEGISGGKGSQYPITRLDGSLYTPGGAVWYKGKVVNYYMSGTSTMYMHNLLNSNTAGRKHLTIDVVISVSGAQSLLAYKPSKNSFTVGWTENEKLAILSAATDVPVNFNEWNNLCLALDYENHTVVPTVNGVRSKNIYPFDPTMSAEKEYSALRVMTAYTPLDNVAVYSGEPLLEDAYVYLPGDDSVPSYNASSLGTNYAENKGAELTSTSNNYIPYTPAEFLTDNVIFDGSDVVWFGENDSNAIIDFGTSIPLDRVVLYQYGKNLEEFSLYRSGNGKDWEALSVADINNWGSGEGRTPFITEAVFPLTFSRYIKLVAEETSGIVMLSELEAYCSITDAVLGNLVTDSDITDEALDAVTGNIFSLPGEITEGADHASIKWSSDKPEVLNAETGVVNRGSEKISVKLTASFEVDGGTKFDKVFNISVLPDVFGNPYTVKEINTADFTDSEYVWNEENNFLVTGSFIVEYKLKESVVNLSDKAITVSKDGEETVIKLGDSEIFRGVIPENSKVKFEVTDGNLFVYIDKNNSMGYRLVSSLNEVDNAAFRSVSFSAGTETVKLCVPETGLIDVILNQFDFAKLSDDAELELKSNIKIIENAMGVSFSYLSSDNAAINPETGVVNTEKPGIYDFTITATHNGVSKSKTFRPVIGNLTAGCSVTATSAAYSGSATQSITENERGRYYLSSRDSYNITIALSEEKPISKILINEAEGYTGNIGSFELYAVGKDGAESLIHSGDAIGEELVITPGIHLAQKIKLAVKRKEGTSVSGIAKLMVFFAPSASDRVQADKKTVQIPATVIGNVELPAVGEYGCAYTYSATGDKVTISPKDGGGYILSVDELDFNEQSDITTTVAYGDYSEQVVTRITLSGKNEVTDNIPGGSDSLGGNSGDGLNAGSGGVGSGSIGRGGSGGSSGKTEDKEPQPSEGNKLTEIENHWAKAEITKLINEGVVKGDGSSLNLDSNITRAEFLAMIIRGGKFKLAPYDNAFSDVKEDDWFAQYMQTGFNEGILKGDGVNANPGSSITRQEAALMLANLFSEADVKEDAFTDREYISEWAKEGVGKAAALGLIKGYEDGSFAPHKNIRRDEAMVVIYRYMQLAQEKEAE